MRSDAPDPPDRVLIVDPDGTLTPAARPEDVGWVDFLAHLVGRDEVEPIGLYRTFAMCVVDRGAPDPGPFNPVASAVAMFFGVRTPIHGTVVFTGPVARSGNATGLDDPVVAFLTEFITRASTTPALSAALAASSTARPTS